MAQPFMQESGGSREDEAISELRERALERLKSTKYVDLQLPDGPSENPWLCMAGIWQDHPDFDEYLKSIEEYRRERSVVENER